MSKDILDKYAKGLGQLVNFDKSAMYFGRNKDLDCRSKICELLGNMKKACSKRHLGLPMVSGKSKNQVFGSLKSCVTNKLQGWKGKLLNQAGKKVLLKAVVIPNYTMSYFRLPKGICTDICKKIANF